LFDLGGLAVGDDVNNVIVGKADVMQDGADVFNCGDYLAGGVTEVCGAAGGVDGGGT